MKILVIHGPNLNALGWREPEKYGHTTLEEVNARLQELAEEAGVELECFQSNHEGAILDRLHQARGEIDVIILNPGGLTHHGGAVRDALNALKIPTVDVHITNIWARQRDYEHNLLESEVIAPVCVGQITGFGVFSYELAFRAALHIGSK